MAGVNVKCRVAFTGVATESTLMRFRRILSCAPATC